MKATWLLVLSLVLPALAQAELKTVPFVDLGKYAGVWYQIARKDVNFEQGCVCSRQVLSAKANGRIGVYNSCNDRTPEGQLREISGEAWPVDNTNSKLVVDFNLPFKGKYWVIALDDKYRWAVVTDPNGYSMYLLSRTPVLSRELTKAALDEAAKQVDVSVLKATRQDGCRYPEL